MIHLDMFNNTNPRQVIKRIMLAISLIVLFVSCGTGNKKMTPEQLREAQKDSTINASFKGLSLGVSSQEVMAKLQTFEQGGDIEKLSTVDLSETTGDYYYAIDAIKPQQITYFNTKMALKDGEGFKEVKISCGLSFLNDTLYTILVLPNYLRSDLERDKVIGTYTEKYGGLYYLEQRPRYEPYGRKYLSGEGYHFNQIYETTAITVDNLVWRYKDAEIYLGNNTEYETIYTYDEDDFRRVWRDLHMQYWNDDSGLCDAMKNRLYGSKKNEQTLHPFIAYKYMPIHNRETNRIEAERAARSKEYQSEKARKDSLENAAAKNLYSNQDI